jgi:hypothetical protein
VADLDGAIDIMRRFQGAEAFQNLQQVADLQSQLRESLMRVEFTLRREVEGDGVNQPVLSGSDAVPAGFRTLVEEYYRSLSRGQQPTPAPAQTPPPPR